MGKYKIRNILITSLILSMLMSTISFAAVNTQNPLIGAVQQQPGNMQTGGTATGPATRIKFRIINGDGPSDEYHAYADVLYSVWPHDQFTTFSDSVMACNQSYIDDKEGWAGGDSMMYIGSRLYKTVNYPTDKGILISWIREAAELIKTTDNPSSLAELPNSNIAGKVLMKAAAEGSFSDYMNEVKSIEDVDPAVKFEAVLIALYSASDGQLEDNAIDIVHVNKNAPGSNSYVFIELTDYVGFTVSDKEWYFFSWPTYYAKAWGMSPIDFCEIPVPFTIDYLTEYNEFVKYYQEQIIALGNGRGLAWKLDPYSSTAMWRIRFADDMSGRIAGAYSYPSRWCTKTVQIHPFVLAGGTTGGGETANGTAGVGHWGVGNLGKSVLGVGMGNIYIKAEPKNQLWKSGSVKADLYLDLKCEVESEKSTIIEGFGDDTEIVITLSKTDESGSHSDSSGKIIDSCDKGTVAGNIITIKPASKEELRQWVSGEKTIKIQDTGLTPSQEGVKIYYSASATVTVKDTKTNLVSEYSMISRGTESRGTLTARDYASWTTVGNDGVLQYHSADGSEKAYAEIKANTPNNEKWEAMAGIPTTEPLYVAAGGQSWQVDITGKVATNPATSRTTTIVVNVTDCWENDTKCSPVCSGHPWVVCPGGVVTGPAPIDPVTGVAGDPPKCGGSSGTASGTGQTVTWNGSCTCGAFNSGSFTHSMGTPTHEGQWMSGGWGDSCSRTTNHTHRHTHTYTFRVVTPIDSFNYFDMSGLDTNVLSSMKFTGNAALLNNPNGTAGNNEQKTNYFNTGNYSPGNGRIFFDKNKACPNVFGNSLYHWGNAVITVTAQAGATAVNGSHSGGYGYPGDVVSAANQTAINCANEVLRKLQGKTYTATVISDYAEVSSDGKWQVGAGCEQDSIPAAWYDGLTFSGINQTLTSVNTIKFAQTFTENELWYNSNLRQLKEVGDVAHVGYNGNYSAVVNNGGMSGKYSSTGNFAPRSLYDKWCAAEGQANCASKVANPGVQMKPPLSVSGFDIKDTYPNGEVKTGQVTITHSDFLRVGSPGTGGMQRNNVQVCNYHSGYAGLNNIVIHDPVSVQHCEIITNDDAYDQRIESEKVLEGGDDGTNNIYGGQTGTEAEDGIAFINLGQSFLVKLSTVGDFAERPNLLGIGSCDYTRGMSYVDNMDCAMWTKEQYIVLPVHVSVEHKDGNVVTYVAGSPVKASEIKPYNGSNDLYQFTCLSNNYEANKTSVRFISVAINGKQRDEYYEESDGVTNKRRSGFKAARHTATKTQTIDVVGFIGNLAINDTGDFRFAELFKKPKENGGWLIDNLVREVDYRKPNKTVADPYDILLNEANAATKYHSTFGKTYATTGGKAHPYAELPLTPADNIIPELKNQNMRPGYNLYMDVETVGNYYGENFNADGSGRHNELFQRMVIKPRYWSYNIDTGVYSPVDVYYGYEGNYQIIVPFNSDDTTFKSEWIYYMNWQEESARRNYVDLEKNLTNSVLEYYRDFMGYDYYNDFAGVQVTWNPDIQAISQNKDRIGTANTLFLDMSNRTFIGSSKTYGKSQLGANVPEDREGSQLDEVIFGRQSQRWHYTLGLPSSSVFVLEGQDCNKANIEALKKTNSVIVCALDIKVQGEIWALEYDGTAINFSEDSNNDGVPDGFELYPGLVVKPPTEVKSNGTTDYIDDPIVVVYDNKYTAQNDLRTEGTH